MFSMASANTCATVRIKPSHPSQGAFVEINKGAVTEPGIVNDDPYGDGWLIKVKLSTDQDVTKLMSAGWLIRSPSRRPPGTCFCVSGKSGAATT